MEQVPAYMAPGAGVASENAHPRPPYVLVGRGLGVHDNLVGEWVRVGGGDGWDVVFVAVDDGYDFVGGFLEGFGHCATDLQDV